MLVDDITPTLPAATPLSRSLSKSVAPREHCQKSHPTPRPQGLSRAEDDISVQSHSQVDDHGPWFAEDISTSQPTALSTSQTPTLNLEDLPPEILEIVAGHVVGRLGSARAAASGSASAIRNWNDIMRHPRRRNISDLALISRIWRRLIQERLFRHIKVQGTIYAQEQCRAFFSAHPHLQPYVRHLQVIVPIWEIKRSPSEDQPEPSQGMSGMFFQTFQAVLPSNNHPSAHTQVETNQIFQLASRNATMDEIFMIAGIYPELCALTIEAGHCKRPPQIKFYRSPERDIWPETRIPRPAFVIPPPRNWFKPGGLLALPALPTVKTLILKGAWNIVRTPTDYAILASAMPQLQEFHCNYHSLKTDAYVAMCITLQTNLISNIVHLNIGLDGLYTKQIASLQKWRKIFPSWHVCVDLGRSIPQLETLTYTGRVCQELFATATQTLRTDDLINTRLRSVNLVVNNVCCDPWLHNDATGIQHYPFIEAFEALIVSAVRALTVFQAVTQLRIRFIDLDSPALLLNPMFHLDRGKAWGFWSEEIVSLMRTARPRVKFLGLRGQLGTLLECDEQEEPKRSLSVDYYRAMAHGGVLIH